MNTLRQILEEIKTDENRILCQIAEENTKKAAYCVLCKSRGGVRPDQPAVSRCRRDVGNVFNCSGSPLQDKDTNLYNIFLFLHLYPLVAVGLSVPY